MGTGNMLLSSYEWQNEKGIEDFTSDLQSELEINGDVLFAVGKDEELTEIELEKTLEKINSICENSNATASVLAKKERSATVFVRLKKTDDYSFFETR